MPLLSLKTATPPKSSRPIAFHISELYHPLFLRLPACPHSQSFARLGSLRQFVIPDIGRVSYLSQDPNTVWDQRHTSFPLEAGSPHDDASR
ncbi:hypothetical protein COCVIDRAFT_43045 [Bipolaris victoriae FI3]|uniref:Uncharacterized protein n=1 Tax=Bipolaris victoriae (strain FI3) TaxID=930091 RepID=W7DXR8_BIPV3|nr:hypothetical protein COCVIDRAFT_43045 [Bipolaris victoriae FI3]